MASSNGMGVDHLSQHPMIQFLSPSHWHCHQEGENCKKNKNNIEYLASFYVDVQQR
jgi:hypothetical protein